MKIVSLHAENFKRLRAVDITPDGHLVEIRGRNGQGKSSVLDAIWATLGGGDVAPSRPVHTGADKAEIRLDLGEYVVIRRFGAAGTTSLVVEAPSGVRFPSPQRLLDGLIGEISFDPLEFARAAPKAQLDRLRQIVKLDIDVEAVDGAYRRDFERRTEINRDAARLRGQASGMVTRSDLPAKVTDTAMLVARLGQASEYNSAIASERARRDREAAEIEDWTEDVEKTEREADRLTRLAAHRRAVIQEKQATLDAAVATPEPIDTAALGDAIREAQATNSEIEKRDRREALDAEAAALEKRSEELTAALAAGIAQKKEALERAKFPVPGLAFGEGEVLFNDVPFEQASQAEKIRVSVGVAIATNPKVRVLCVRDGSLLDRESWKLLSELVTLNDYQCWVEVTDDDGKVGIIIEDGAVRVASEAEAESKPDPKPRRAGRRASGAPDLLAGDAR